MSGSAILAVLLAAAMPAAGASPAATALAEALTPAEPSGAAIDATAQALARTLRTSMSAARGRPCDQTVPACAAAAERFAREEAPSVLAQRRAVRVAMQAAVIDETMTPIEIAAAIAFARTPAGQALGRAFGRDPASLSPAARERLGRILMQPPVPDGRRSLLDRFYDATEGLPRGALPMVPPPPMPSPPSPGRQP